MLHNSYRKCFDTDLRSVGDPAEADINNNTSKTLRSVLRSFDWKHCASCIAQLLISRVKLQTVRTAFVNRLHSNCVTQFWNSVIWDKTSGLMMCSRLEMFSDLIAAEAVYHHNCRTRFLGFRSLDAGGVCGWPVSLELCYAFWAIMRLAGGLLWTEFVFSWRTPRENDTDCCKHYTRWINTRMWLCPNSPIRLRRYTSQLLKRKLLEKCGDFLFSAEVAGWKNVVCFRAFSLCLINNKW